jgi:hypothetical protein
MWGGVHGAPSSVAQAVSGLEVQVQRCRPYGLDASADMTRVLTADTMPHRRLGHLSSVKFTAQRENDPIELRTAGYEFDKIFPGCRLIDIHEYLATFEPRTRAASSVFWSDGRLRSVIRRG